MKEESLEKLFEELEGHFDIEEPMEGHQARFLDKLGTVQGTVSLNRKKPTTWWRPLSIAASIIVLCALAIGLPNLNPSTEQQLANISPEVSETRLYFTSLIEQQVNELQTASTPQTEQLVTEALAQLKKLDENYMKLEQDLINGGDPNLILSAMINNFQTRIALLQDVRDQIESIENYNNYDDENYTI